MNTQNPTLKTTESKGSDVENEKIKEVYVLLKISALKQVNIDKHFGKQLDKEVEEMSQ